MSPAEPQPRRDPEGPGKTRRPGRPPLAEQRRVAARLEIAMAAVELFVEKGLDGTSAGDIADAVGISTRTLWRYFPSKEECVGPLLQLGAQRLSRRLAEWPTERPLAEALGDVYVFQHTDAEVRGHVLELLKLTRSEPTLYAVWSRENFAALPVVAEAFAARQGKADVDFEARVQAGMLLSALHVALQEYTWGTHGENGRTLTETLRDAAGIAIAGLPF